MGIETGVALISDLNQLWPLTTDDRATTDDHLRLIKVAVRSLLPAAGLTNLTQIGFPATAVGQGGKYLKVSAAETAIEYISLGDSATRNVGTAAGTVAEGDHTHSGVYAPAAQGVTNGNTHDHLGGDGATLLADNILPTQTGNSGKYLKTNGTSSSWETGGRVPTLQVFTSGGTWTKPSGVTKVKVTVVAAGGGGSGASTGESGAGGGAGGTAIAYVDVSAISSVAVTIGTGGTGGTAGGGGGGNGGVSSFGTHAAASGGTGASSTASAGSGGIGTAGNLLLSGGAGSYGRGNYDLGGAGGTSFMGGGGRGSSSGVTPGGTGGNYGGGGGGGAYNASAGGAGAGGVVIVEEY